MLNGMSNGLIVRELELEVKGNAIAMA
jgi:hypothetical protein